MQNMLQSSSWYGIMIILVVGRKNNRFEPTADSGDAGGW